VNVAVWVAIFAAFLGAGVSIIVALQAQKKGSN
jgi:hypothetical protein